MKEEFQFGNQSAWGGSPSLNVVIVLLGPRAKEEESGSYATPTLMRAADVPDRMVTELGTVKSASSISENA